MRQKIAKTRTQKSEALGEVPQAPISFDLFGTAPNSQGISEQANKQQVGGISAENPEIKDSISEEPAKSLGNKTEFSGETSQASNSSSSRPKTAQLQRFSAKPQISSLPGMSPKERHRYRVALGSEVLGTHLTLDQALLLANQSTHP